jgi:hypothetical protein
MSSPCGLFSRAEDAFETSDDVIKEAFTIVPAICRELFPALPQSSGRSAGSSCRFGFDKRTQLFIRSHNETLSVARRRASALFAQ